MVLREEVELSNTRTAYIMHIPNTLSLSSARNNWFLREDWGEFQNWIYVIGGRSIKKSVFQNLHRDISFRTQCDKESASMKIKGSKHKLNIHYRGSPWGSRTQQHAYCLHYAHSQHIESQFGKKQLQANIPIAFLFSQLHFNNVTSHPLFYGGHLVMRSKRCAVQNEGITLNLCTKTPIWSRTERLSTKKNRNFNAV